MDIHAYVIEILIQSIVYRMRGRYWDGRRIGAENVGRLELCQPMSSVVLEPLRLEINHRSFRILGIVR